MLFGFPDGFLALITIFIIIPVLIRLLGIDTLFEDRIQEYRFKRQKEDMLSK